MTVPQPSENFLDRALHELKSCVTSYFVDYNALGDVYDASEDVLEVWILTGRDQSTVLKTMVDDTFTPSTGIPVNVMLVDPNALLNAVVAATVRMSSFQPTAGTRPTTRFATRWRI